MALRFIDGFDHYTTTAAYAYKYTAYTASAAPGVGRRGGSNAARFANYGGDYLLKTLDDQATWIVGFAYKRDYASNDEKPILQLRDNTGAVQVALCMHGIDGLLRLWRGDQTTLLATSSIALPTGSWNFIELKTTIHDTTGSMELRVNGVTVATYTGDTKYSSTIGTARSIRLSGGVYSSSLYGWIDDLYICDGTGTTNNDFLGDCRVDTLYPNGVGATAQFTPTGSATNWENVDDVPSDEDSSYNASDTVGTIDSFTFTDMAVLNASVFGVQANILARKDDAGSRTLRAVVRVGGANYEGGDLPLGDSYLNQQLIWPTNPATAGAWTETAINAAEFGYKVQA
ncbi:MAG: hypothetical protein RBT70_04815 [Alphaproteobacteria bacterium]|jgi:hypothetical protein|nr:hypothetical protein [Alphaproteobacteria bacterium]